MKAKFKKGDIIRLKATGELVKVEYITPAPGGFWYDLRSTKENGVGFLPGSYAESELTKIN